MHISEFGNMSRQTKLQSFPTLEAMIGSAVRDFTGEIKFIGGKDFSKATDRVAAEVRRIQVSLSGGKSRCTFIYT